MAAVDIVPLSNPFAVKQTLSGTPNTQQEFKIKGSHRRVEIQFVGAAGVVIFNGGTDGAVIGSEIAYPIAADATFFYDVPNAQGDHSIWLASGTASTVCFIVVGD